MGGGGRGTVVATAAYSILRALHVERSNGRVSLPRRIRPSTLVSDARMMPDALEDEFPSLRTALIFIVLATARCQSESPWLSRSDAIVCRVGRVRRARRSSAGGSGTCATAVSYEAPQLEKLLQVSTDLRPYLFLVVGTSVHLMEGYLNPTWGASAERGVGRGERAGPPRGRPRRRSRISDLGRSGGRCDDRS